MSISETETEVTEPRKMVKVPIVKGKQAIEVDVQQIPQDMWDQVVLAGLKVVLNGGATKLTKKEIPDEEELKTKAMEVADDRLQQLYDGTLRIGRGSTSTKQVSGEVKIEARQQALKTIKAQLKKQGFLLRDYDPKDLRAAADDLLESEDGESIYKEAQAAIDARNKKTLDLSGLKPSANAKAKADRRSKERKSDVSAAQAGRPQPHRPSPRA
jgi:hypothetical protein